MKNLIKNSLFLFVLFLSGILNAAENRYDLYKCGSVFELEACSACKKTNFQATFKAQNINNVVIRTHFKDGKLQSSDPLKNCKVVDEENWQCESDENISYTSTERMINGTYTMIWITNNSELFRCGKKRKFFNIF